MKKISVEEDLKKKLKTLSYIKNEMDTYKKKCEMLDRFFMSPSFFSFFFCLKERKNRRSELRKIQKLASDKAFREIRTDFFNIIKNYFDRVDDFYRLHRKDYRATE